MLQQKQGMGQAAEEIWSNNVFQWSRQNRLAISWGAQQELPHLQKGIF